MSARTRWGVNDYKGCKIRPIGSILSKLEPGADNFQIVMIAIVRPISLNFQEPIVFLLNLYIALIYGKRILSFCSFLERPPEDTGNASKASLISANLTRLFTDGTWLIS